MKPYKPRTVKAWGGDASTDGMPPYVNPLMQSDEFQRAPVGAWKGLDYLNRLDYPVANMARLATMPGSASLSDYGSAAWRGISGQERSNYSDVIGNLGWNPETTAGKFGKGTLGFVADVGLSPLTWLNPTSGITKLGLLAKAGKAIRVGDEVLDVTKDLDRLVNVAKSPETKSLIQLSGTGILTPNKIDNIVSALNQDGVAASKFTLAPTLQAQSEAGQRGLLNIMGRQIPLPYQDQAWRGLDAAGNAIKTAEADAATKIAAGVQPTPFERLAQGAMTLKRGFGFKSDAMKMVEASSKGAKAQTIDDWSNILLKKMGDSGTGINNLEDLELVELAGPSMFRDVLSKVYGPDWLTTPGSVTDISKGIDAIDKTGLLSPERIGRMRDTASKMKDPDAFRRGIDTLSGVEDMNRLVGLVDPAVTASREVAEGTLYARHRLEPSIIASLNESGTGKKGIPGTTANVSREHHRFQTGYEANTGLLDPYVKAGMVAIKKAKNLFGRRADGDTGVVNWFNKMQGLSELPPEKKNELTDLYSVWRSQTDPLEKNKAVKDIENAIDTVTVTADGKNLKASDILRTTKHPVTFGSDVDQIVKQSVAIAGRHAQQYDYLDGLMQFAKPKGTPGTIDMSELVGKDFAQRLAYGGDTSKQLALKIDNAALDYDTFKTAQQFLDIDKKGGLLGLLKTATDFFKPWLLTSPGYLTRNVVSNVFMTKNAGHDITSPAFKFWLSALNHKGELAKPDLKYTINGVEYTAKQIFDELRQAGLSVTGQAELLVPKAEPSVGHTLKKLAMILPETTRDWNNGTEGVFRLANATQYLEDGWDPKSAALGVAKYFYDYGDLTPSEKRIQGFVPFYSWMRKNIERQVANLAQDPKYMALPQKLANSIGSVSQGASGAPANWTPDWVQRTGQMALPSGSFGRLQGWMPQLDVLRVDPRTYAQSLEESISPAIKLPYELSKNQSLYTGKTIAEPGREKSPYLGMMLDKRAQQALGWIRPLSEANKSLLPSIPGYQDWAKARGGYSQGGPLENAASWASGLNTSNFEPKRMAMDRYRALQDQVSKLRYASTLYPGAPVETARIQDMLAKTKAEMDTLVPQMKARGEYLKPKTNKRGAWQ